MFDPVIAPSGTLLGLLQRGRGDGTLHALAAPRAEALAALNHCVLQRPPPRLAGREPLPLLRPSLSRPRRRARRDRAAPLRPRRPPRHRRVSAPASPSRSSATSPPTAARDALRAAAPLRRYRRQLGMGPRRAGPARRRRRAARPRRPRPRPLPGRPRGRRRARRRRARRLRTPALAAVGRRPASHGARVRAAQEQGSFDRWQRQMRPSAARAPAGASRPSSTGPSRASTAGRARTSRRRPLPGRRRRPRGPARDRRGRRGAAPTPPAPPLCATSPRRRPRRPRPDRGRRGRPASAPSPRPPSPPSSACAASPPSTGPAAGPHRPDALGAAAAAMLACRGGQQDATLVLAALRDAGTGRGPRRADPVDPRRRRRTARHRLRRARTAPCLPRDGLLPSARPGRPARWPPPIPPSPPGFAVECLWDCEETTREVAARHAATGDVRVVEQLRRLAADPAEEAEVQTAVRSRIGPEGPAVLNRSRRCTRGGGTAAG